MQNNVPEFRYVAEADAAIGIRFIKASTDRQVDEVLPVEHWNRINFQLIYHGRSICTARKAKCGECPIAKWCAQTIEPPRC
ncbi:MAG: hypothetical protein J6B85_08340 [Lachnospiraceae bacterium]|nr:hypothetical protein [Lachnospiraceae bacterium]